MRAGSVPADAQTTPAAAEEVDTSTVTGIASLRDRRLSSALGIGLVVVSIFSGLATYAILANLTPIKPTQDVNVVLALINMALIGAMLSLVAWQVVHLVKARRKKLAGARLNLRIITMVSVFTAVPALVVAMFATLTIGRGLDFWSSRTGDLVETGLVVADAYLRKQGEVVGQKVFLFTQIIRQNADRLEEDPAAFERLVQDVGRGQHLDAAFIFDDSLNVIHRWTRNSDLKFRPPPREAMARADAGEMFLLPAAGLDHVTALIKLGQPEDRYLYVYQLIEPEVAKQLGETYRGKEEFEQLEARRSSILITFGLMYVGVSLIFLLAAIWVGLWVADRMVQPIVRLVGAARAVSEGQLGVKVPVRHAEGDLATLGKTFNQMTSQLSSQRAELVNANHMLDQRRRFIEAVLSGGSAGVIGHNRAGRITLVNRSALTLLGREANDLEGRPLRTAIPELATFFDKARRKASGSAEGQVNITCGGEQRNFTVRVTTEQSQEKEHGYVVTFDDMTDLVTAQRNSAWADIARRIAHEIKNPLTPIQLSAERLRRKYIKDIKTDRDVFEQCTETIIRQVGDIGRMVDEFSAFARMPKAVIEPQDFGQLVKEALILQRESSSDIAFEIVLPEESVTVDCDRRLVRQAVTNLVKNAAEAIDSRRSKQPDHKGRIVVTVRPEEAMVALEVADNGIGLPRENRQRLFEPYMTTREKGTGLGLAIVKRIMEEHEGRITLHDAPEVLDGGQGALLRLEFPLTGAGKRGTAGRDADSNPMPERATV